jgi:chromosome segregation ATPase
VPLTVTTLIAYGWRMPVSDPGPQSQGADACAEVRRMAAIRCDEARAAAQAHAAAGERTRMLRRDLVAGERALATAETSADPGVRSAAKSVARETYLSARERATSESELREAAATWAHALDRINRTSRLATRTLERVRAEVAALDRAVREAERVDQAARIRAEAAESDCLDARVRLAACEERLSSLADPGQADEDASTGRPAAN